MKKLFSYLLLSSVSLPFVYNPAKADVRFLVNQKDNQDQEIIKMTSTSSGNTLELLTTWDYSENGNIRFNGRFFDSDQNKLYFQQMSESDPYTLDKFSVYDITNDSWSTETLNNVTTDSTPNYQMVDEGDAMHTSKINTNTSNISTNTSNIKSLGEGVAGSTALTAALTALPQTSKESKLSCGVGTGAYSSRYAIGFGCASKVNERVDINAGGSYVFGGSKSYGSGTLDSGVVKAGFVFKLGELNKHTQISFNDKKIINKKISDLEKNNKNLKAKNDEIISQNQKLLARLEKIENIALKIQSNPELISVATKD
ncbi:MAG: YadA C-terminal domain-containing protein [Prochlorococcus marinus subsp. pastoris]